MDWGPTGYEAKKLPTQKIYMCAHIDRIHSYHVQNSVQDKRTLAMR